MKNILKIGIAVLALSVLFGLTAAAEGPDAKADVANETAKVLPKRGTLSSSVTGGFRGSLGVDLPPEADLFGEGEAAPITGSVSRFSAQQWMMRVLNNSDDKYSVSLEVAQYNIRGTKIKSDSFSYTVAPKETVERQISVQTGADRAVLKLRNWRNLSGKSK